MCMWTKCHDTLVKVRGQLARVCSFLLSCGFQGLNSQYQGWQHMPFLLSSSTSSCLPPPVYIHVIRNCILWYRNCNVHIYKGLNGLEDLVTHPCSSGSLALHEGSSLL